MLFRKKNHSNIFYLNTDKRGFVQKNLNKFLVDGKTINNRHEVVTIGFFFTDNMFRTLRQDPPLEAILVIFGRRALNSFLFECSKFYIRHLDAPR